MSRKFVSAARPPVRRRTGQGEHVGRADAFTAIRAVFAAMARGDAYNLPVIREAIGHADALYGRAYGGTFTRLS